MDCSRCGMPVDDKYSSCIYCGATIVHSNQNSDTNEKSERVRNTENALLREIRQVFPDEIVEDSQWNHSRWDKPAAFVCRKLG